MKQGINSAVLAGVACLSLLSIGSASAADDSVHWTYEGERGPAAWGRISEDFAVCEAGRMQSPIDLRTDATIGNIQLDMAHTMVGATIVDKGHTLQADLAPGSAVTVGGKSFSLLQFHLHTPSEHTVSGKAYPLTAHLVHAAEDGELLVVGVFFEAGEANAELQKLVDAAKSSKGAKDGMLGKVEIDPVALVPEDKHFHRYMGSLTTPPCSEGVNWYVIDAAQTASADQIAALAAIMGDNARPVQPLNNRLVVAPN